METMRIATSAALLCIAGCGTDGIIDLFPRALTGGLVDASAEDAGGATSEAGTQPDATAPCNDSGACPCGLTDCGGVCVDVMNDPNHCGGCGIGLLHFQLCRGGAPECLTGFALCSGACRPVSSDPDHCGACDNAACTTGQKCEGGVCGVGACGAGLTGCAKSDGRTACVDLATGVANCGDCTTVCGPNQVCAAGTCREYSPATPCLTCPCAAECTRAQGAGSACCSSLAGAGQNICVHGTVCP